MPEELEEIGPIPEATKERVARADPGVRDRWLDRVLSAPTIEAVFDADLDS